MLEAKKMVSSTRTIDDKFGITVFAPEEAADDKEALDAGVDIGLAIVPILCECAVRHLDEFEDEEVKEVICALNDWFQDEMGSAE